MTREELVAIMKPIIETLEEHRKLYVESHDYTNAERQYYYVKGARKVYRAVLREVVKNDSKS